MMISWKQPLITHLFFNNILLNQKTPGLKKKLPPMHSGKRLFTMHGNRQSPEFFSGTLSFANQFPIAMLTWDIKLYRLIHAERFHFALPTVAGCWLLIYTHTSIILLQKKHLLILIYSKSMSDWLNASWMTSLTLK